MGLYKTWHALQKHWNEHCTSSTDAAEQEGDRAVRRRNERSSTVAQRRDVVSNQRHSIKRTLEGESGAEEHHSHADRCFKRRTLTAVHCSVASARESVMILQGLVQLQASMPLTVEIDRAMSRIPMPNLVQLPDAHSPADLSREQSQ